MNSFPHTIAAIIPALNEESTLPSVIAAVKECSAIGEVIVVDNGSIDDTANVAAAAGARVVHEPQQGKGEAVRQGIMSTDANIIVLLDGDLIGLTPTHIEALIWPLLTGAAAMTCGLCDRGWLSPLFQYVLPILTGQRAFQRNLIECLNQCDIKRYRLESALNAYTTRRRLSRLNFVCSGLTHRSKERKFSNPLLGFLCKQLMFLETIQGYFCSLIRGVRAYG
jgi:polyisoprenyl-phosphate glycosyltransferase